MPVKPLCKELQEKAAKELNEVPDRVNQDIEAIKEWISKQPHMHFMKDDQWILSYLRASKFSLHITKQKLYHYCMLRVCWPKPFSNRDPFLPELQEFLNSGAIMILPETDILAPRRLFVQAKQFDPDSDMQSVFLKVIAMTVELLLLTDDSAVVNGQEVIVNSDQLKYKTATQFTPPIIKMLALAMQKSYPVRLKAIYFFNVPSFVSSLITLFKSFLPEKLSSRIFAYNKDSPTQIDKVFPQSILPNEYGGNAGSTEDLTGKFKSKIEASSDWFIKDGKRVISEEELAVWKSLDIYDVEGSFRKLDID